MHLSWYIPIWTHAASHTSPAQLTSLFTSAAILYQAWISFLLSCFSCSSALTSPHWCLSPGCHLCGSHQAAGRLDTDLPHLALHSLVTQVAKICHNLNFLRKPRPRHWVDSLPAPGRTALPCCSFAYLCEWQLRQQVFPSQSLSGVGFPALAELGPHLERRAPHCVCLSFIPGNLTPETVSVRFRNMLKSNELTAQGTLPFTNSLETHYNSS